MAPTDRSRTPSDDGNTTKLAVASGVGAPPLTVWLGSAMYTFPAERDVTVGRDRGCDICFHDLNPGDLTLISRVHALLRFDGSKWVVIDKSQNGVYVSGSRAPVVPIHDRLSITLGSPRGPQLTFRVATSRTPSEPRNPRTWAERTHPERARGPQPEDDCVPAGHSRLRRPRRPVGRNVGGVFGPDDDRPRQDEHRRRR